MAESAPLSAQQPRNDPPGARPQPSTPPSRDVSPVTDVIAAVCPFLVAADGAWRSATPTREHRCGAMDPAGKLSLDKQQNLCLTAAHLDCPLFEAAAGLTVGPHLQEAARAAAATAPAPAPRSTFLSDPAAGTDAADAASPDHRPVPRTTPVILDRGRQPLDGRLPGIRLPSLFRRGDGAAVGSSDTPQTRLAELRAARMRAREAAAATAAVDGENDTVDEAAAAAVAGATASRPTSGSAAAAGYRPPSASSSATRPADASAAAPRPTTASAARPATSTPSGSAPGRGLAGLGAMLAADGGLARRFGFGGGSTGAPDDDRDTGSDDDDDLGSLARPTVIPIPRTTRPSTASPAASTAAPDPGAGSPAPTRPSAVPGYRSLGRVAGTGGAGEGVRTSLAGREIQIALAGLMALALILVLVVRFSGGEKAGVAGASSSPRPSAAASALASPNASPQASGAAGPGVAGASAAPSKLPKPSRAPATTKPKPTASAAVTATRSYKVKSGDTLSTIAAKFGTTVAVLMHLNNITDPKALRVGQVLKIP
jgi:LysM repeat protein